MRIRAFTLFDACRPCLSVNYILKKVHDLYLASKKFIKKLDFGKEIT